jgi:hypothetical protein
MSRTQRELKALRQQQRAEAAARQRARDRRNLMIIAGTLVVVAVAIFGVASYLNHLAQQQAASRLAFSTAPGTCLASGSGPCIGTKVADEGRTHIDVSTTSPYATHPPTSGPHYNAQGIAPVAWQTIATLQEGQYIHNLEHGGIVILYNCSSGNDCTTLQQQLKNYVQNLAPVEPRFGEVKMVMTPYSQGMQKKVALLAWDYIQFLDGYDQNAITRFYENHVDQGPEQIA